MKTAILIDGGFYRRRANTIFGRLAPADRVDEIIEYCKRHIGDDVTSLDDERLYRIFYYDCPPMVKKLYHRKDLNMNQKEFAKMLGVSQGMISKWENLEYSFTISSLLELMDKLGVDVEILLDGRSITRSM